MIIEDLNMMTDPKAIKFEDIPQGEIFFGKSGYQEYSLYLKVDITKVYNLQRNILRKVGLQDVFYHYRLQSAKLTIKDKE